MVLLLLPSFRTITSSFLLKLTTSLDDLLWLSPFLSLSPSVHNKMKHSIVYFIICIVVTMVAFIFGTTLLTLMKTHGGEKQGYWNPERFLSIISSTVLLYIARNEYNEWKEENNNKSSKKSSSEEKSMIKSSSRTIIKGIDEIELLPSTPPSSKGLMLRARPTATRQSSRRSIGSYLEDCSLNNDSDNSNDDDDDEEVREKIEEASKSLRQFVIVCVMGTLDDMIVFSAFVASGSTVESGGSKYLALFIGTTFAALLIVSVSWFFSEIKWFKRIVKKIPMWALLGGFSIYILIMGLL